jgi:hypothetical protein
MFVDPNSRAIAQLHGTLATRPIPDSNIEAETPRAVLEFVAANDSTRSPSEQCWRRVLGFPRFEAQTLPKDFLPADEPPNAEFLPSHHPVADEIKSAFVPANREQLDAIPL